MIDPGRYVKRYSNLTNMKRIGGKIIKRRVLRVVRSFWKIVLRLTQMAITHNLSFEYLKAIIRCNKDNKRLSCIKKLKENTETILKNKTYPPGTEPALSTCVELYDDANNSLNEALMNVKSADYKSANVDLSAASDEPGTCEDGFKETHAKSPITNKNNKANQFRAATCQWGLRIVQERSEGTPLRN
ncbi:hypothetical protein YC2023_024739 [Brassica napus]